MDTGDSEVQIQEAFAWAIHDITAPTASLASLREHLLPLLGAAGRLEDTTAARRVASDAFRLNRWRWHAYERFVQEGDAIEQLADAKLRIEKLSDSDVLANCMNLVEIKHLASSEGIDIKGLRSKVAVAERILTVSGPSASVRDLTEKYRNAMLHDAERKIFDEMGELLVHRIQSKKYALNRDQSNFDPNIKPFLVGLRLSPNYDERTPRECIDASRTIRPVDDEFWKTHRVPCERLLCRCIIIPIVLGSEEAKQFLSQEPSKESTGRRGS